MPPKPPLSSDLSRLTDATRTILKAKAKQLKPSKTKS